MIDSLRRQPDRSKSPTMARLPWFLLSVMSLCIGLTALAFGNSEEALAAFVGTVGFGLAGAIAKWRRR
jgi:hypothetical protein